MTESDDAPIACTLSPDDYAERVASIRDLNRSLQRYDQEGLVLELHYPLDVVTRVRELVHREHACCSFLRFEIERSVTTTLLRIHAPDETREAIDAIFAPFLSGVGDVHDGDVDDGDVHHRAQASR